jgi:PAS domain S-box-containing protein
MGTRTSLAVLLALCALSRPAEGDVPPEGAPPASRPRIVFVGSSSNLPLHFSDVNGAPKGFVIDLLKALGRTGGFEVVFDLLPGSEWAVAFREGRGDLTGVEPDSETAQGTVPLVPLWTVRELAMFVPSRPVPPRSLADLAKDTVAVVDASPQQASLMRLPLERRPRIDVVPSIESALRKLRQGEVTAVLGHSLSIRQTAEYGESPPLGEAELRVAPYLLVARPGREALQPLIMSAYLRLQESGELTSIIERSLMRPAGRGELTGWRTYLLLSLGLGTTALLGMLIWSRSLQREVQRRTRELRAAGERQAMQAHVLSQVTDAIVMTDDQATVTSWNAGAEQLFGLSAADAMGEPVTGVITNQLAARRGGDLNEAIGSRSNWRGDAELVRPSGETLFVEATVRPVTDVSGQVSGTLIVARDVDARRRAELEAEIRARQQAVIASLGQRALAGIDRQLLLDQAMSMARSTLQMTAAAAFELVEGGTFLTMRAGEGWEGRHGDGMRVPADSSIYPACAFAADGGAVTIEPRGDSRPVDAFLIQDGMTSSGAVVIPGRAGPYGLLLVSDRRERRFSPDDVHFLRAVANVIGAALERSVIDAELRTELALHDATLEAAADGILVTDAAGRVRRYNQRLLDMWAFPSDILQSRDPDRWAAWALSQHETPGARLMEFRTASPDAAQSMVIALKDGRVIERHSRPQLVDGAVAGRVWCYRDITERVRADEERRRLESQMQHVQKLESLGVLAGGIAHDFNNLLVGMLGHAGLALTELPPDSEARDRITQIQTTAQRAAELTNQMLAYSGKGRFVLQSADLSDIVGEMSHLLRTAVAKNAAIVLELDPDLPAFDGDPAQIRQVIMNLITNASDAIGAAPGTITLQTGRMRVTRAYVADAWIGGDLPEGEYVFAEVQDTGCGMDAATLGRIFDPFFSTKFTGRGLGLAAVLGIVRGHHGAIKIASEPGRGTTFRVLLPATHRPATPVVLPVKPALTSAKGARVLVVDDEPGVRTIARESLKRAGFEVVTANDGAEAVDLLAADRKFDAVLLDMTMPRMNGVEAFRRIKELQPALPVVLTSGYSAQDAAGQFGSDGIAGFIQKPFMPSALGAAMLEALSQRKRDVA